MAEPIGSLVGTPVWSAEDDDRERTILVSDLHLPFDGGAAFDRLRALLGSIDRPAATRLVVLGDLFDVYINRRQNEVGVFRDTAAALAGAAAAGVSVSVMHGNRDFMLDAAFAEAARCRVVAGGLAVRLGDAPCVLLHGDELCQRDLPYQRAKRILRHPLTRFVLRRLPLALAARAARRARMRSAAVIASGDQGRFDPTAEAVGSALAGATETLVFGHIHRPARGRVAAGEYVILPAFDATGVCLEHRDGALRYRDAAGAEVPDYPPREFC